MNRINKYIKIVLVSLIIRRKFLLLWEEKSNTKSNCGIYILNPYDTEIKYPRLARKESSCAFQSNENAWYN